MSTSLPAPGERHPIEIRSTGYVRMRTPSEPGPGPAPALIAVHGYAQPPEEMFAYACSVAPAGTVIIAPEGPSSFYTRTRMPDGTRKRGVSHGWIADEPRQPSERRNRDLLAGALDLAARQQEIDPARTWLLGYSQGVGVSTDFFVHAPERIAGMVALAGGVPDHGRPALPALAGRPVLWVCGTEDSSYPPLYMDAVVEDFQRAGVAIERLVLPIGHAVLEPARRQVAAWLASH